MDLSKPYYRVVAPAGFAGYPKRRPYYCKSRAAANTLRWRIRHWKAERKLPGVQAVVISDQERNWLGYLKNRLGDLSKLPGVIDFWERNSADVLDKTTVHDMCSQFIEFKAGESDSRRTLNDIKYRLRQFVHRYGDSYAHEVTTPQLREFLQSIPKGDSRRNSFKWLSPAFEFARERHMIAANPFDGIDRPPAGRTEGPGIYSPEAFARLLLCADTQFPELLPFLACAGFAGLRTSELLRAFAADGVVRWNDILWDKGLLHVRPDVAKRTQRKAGDRRYPPLEPALAHWLEPYRKDTGLILPGGSGLIMPWSHDKFTAKIRSLFISAEVTPVRNGLRHSFASYWLARAGQEGVGRLAVILGNSEAVAKRHYVETMEPGDGDAWFDIRRLA